MNSKFKKKTYLRLNVDGHVLENQTILGILLFHVLN